MDTELRMDFYSHNSLSAGCSGQEDVLVGVERLGAVLGDPGMFHYITEFDSTLRLGWRSLPGEGGREGGWREGGREGGKEGGREGGREGRGREGEREGGRVEGGKGEREGGGGKEGRERGREGGRMIGEREGVREERRDERERDSRSRPNVLHKCTHQ